MRILRNHYGTPCRYCSQIVKQWCVTKIGPHKSGPPEPNQWNWSPGAKSFPKSCSMLKDLFPPFLKQIFKLQHARLVYVLQISLLSCSTCTTCFDKNLDSVELHIPWAACGTAHQLQIALLSYELLVYVFIFSVAVITAFRVSWFSTSQTYLGLLRPPQFRSLLGSSQAFSDRHCPSTIASAVLKVQKSKLRLGNQLIMCGRISEKKRSSLP